MDNKIDKMHLPVPREGTEGAWRVQTANVQCELVKQQDCISLHVSRGVLSKFPAAAARARTTRVAYWFDMTKFVG